MSKESSNGTNEVSIIDIDEVIKDRVKIKESLAREINGKQIEASNLRDTVAALTDKVSSLRAEITKFDQIVLKRREEDAGLSSKYADEIKRIECDRRDLIALKEVVGGEQLLWTQEKKAQTEALNDERSKFARFKMDLESREVTLKNSENQASAILRDCNEKLLVAESDKQKAMAERIQAKNELQDAQNRLREADKAKDEAEAARVRYETLEKEHKAKLLAFDQKESHIKTCMDEIELKQLNLKDRERDVVIDEDRIKNLKSKLRKELEYAAISKDKKEAIKKELE